MNVWLHSEKIILFFSYNVPVLAVCSSSTDVYLLRKGSALQYYCRSHITSTLYKPDTSLRWTVRAVPEGVLLREIDCMLYFFHSLRKQLMDYATPPLVPSPPPPREMTSEEPRVTIQIWVVLLIGWRKFPSRPDQSQVFNNYSSRPKAEWAIDSEAMSPRRIIVLVKSN